MSTPSRARLEADLRRAQAASDRAAAARAALPPGSSRARVTTANARWMRAAEERDRCQAALDAAAAPPPTDADREGTT